MNRFISEFCAPVVVLTSTGESEAIALKNGLLLHELLSAFGHLDGISATVRGSSANFHMTDAHIRFERETEVRAKTPGEVDALLQQRFEEFDLSRMPATVGDMRTATPSAWSLAVEQIVMRSMSFSEFEMISHPLVLMTVVATSDLDPVACMQQLASVHHTPQCMLSGQFDPDIHRLYLLIHDASNTTVDPNAIYRKLIAAGFPQQQTKYLALNSLPTDAPNLQQPDMWSRWLIPKYFPNDAPSLDPSRHSLPTNPADGTKVLCSLLSMEDFMALREFCVALFHKEIVPALEKRIGTLTKQVNEARKGVKNVLKSFWRKPREETGSTKGALRYRYDRIESQILLLADTSLSIKDYDTAASMYKLVRDDYRSDKSQLHLAHTALMLAVCQWIECTASGSGSGSAASGSGSAGRSSKDLLASLESLREVMQTLPALDPPHSHAHFALLASELYASSAARAPLAAAEFLLHSAGVCGRFPLLSGLLGERAAAYFLQAGLTRKFSLHVMLAGQRMRAVGPRPRRHSLACYVAAMVVHDTGRWDGIKTKLSRAIAEEMKHTSWGPTGAQRSLLVLLKLLAIALGSRSSGKGGGGDSPTGHASALAEASAVLAELQQPGPWGSVSVADSWSQSSTRQLLLGSLPMTTHVATTGGSSALVDVEGGLPLPSLSQRFLSVMLPANGIGTLVAHDAPPTPELQQAEELRGLLALERQWGLEIEGKGPSGEGGSGWGGQWGSTQSSAQSSAGTMSTSNSCADLPRLAAAPGAGGSTTPTPSGAQAVQELLDRWVTLELDISAAFDRSKASGCARHAPRIPLGEPVVLRLQLRNRLPVELSVSQLQLQVVRAKEAGGIEASGAGSSTTGLEGAPEKTAAAADIVPGDKLDVTIAPFASIEVLLSVLPPRPGTYCAQSLLWNLSPHLRVRQRLFKSGALLQKTLAQRSARERSADTSVSFEVVAPHALLRTSLTGLSSDALQGELSGCSLVLRNEGRAPACDIAVKFNHPCCVLLAGKLLAPFGQSATVTLLPTGTVIAPGAELTLAVWARLNLVGRYPLTAITAYSAITTEGAGTIGSTALTTARVRTSVVSVDVNVAPSLTLLANVVDRPSSTCVRTVVLSLSNVIQSPGGAAPGSSSLPPPPKASISVAKPPPLPAPAVGLGGVTSGPLGGDEALRPSSVVIEGIYLLGAAVGGAGQGGAGLGAENVLCAAPGERLSFCLPVSTTPSTTPSITSAARPLSGHCTWLLPLRPELTSPSPGSSVPDLEPLVAQSLCQLYATVRLHRLLREARAQHKEAEADEGGGPRSLQQVRRDKERERERELLTAQGGNHHAKSMAASASSSNVHTADSANFVTAFSADDAATAEARGGVGDGEGEAAGLGSFSSLGVPMSAADLAALEARQGNVNLTIVWSCLWKGAVRRGMHSVSQISLFSGVGLGPVTPRPTLADSMLVGITHPSSAVLSVDSGLELDVHETSANGRRNGSITETSPASRAKRARVPVLLELRSISEETLSVDVEAVEAPDLQGGVRWEGKVAYAQVLLAPMSSVVLPFFAVVSKAGVFDLKRFTVVVTSHDRNVLPSTKQFSDNSFVQVVDAGCPR